MGKLCEITQCKGKRLNHSQRNSSLFFLVSYSTALIFPNHSSKTSETSKTSKTSKTSISQKSIEIPDIYVISNLIRLNKPICSSTIMTPLTSKTTKASNTSKTFTSKTSENLKNSKSLGFNTSKYQKNEISKTSHISKFP